MSHFSFTVDIVLLSKTAEQHVQTMLEEIQSESTVLGLKIIMRKFKKMKIKQSKNVFFSLKKGKARGSNTI